MSSVVISGNTSGTITLDAPNVAGTTVLTLPTANGTVLTTANVSSNLPAGSVLQVVSATKTDTASFTSSTFSDVTGLSVSITPSSSSNKILILVNVNGSWQNGITKIGGRLMRDSTAIAIGDAAGSRTRLTSELYFGVNGDTFIPMSMNYLDSPSTTSATTYKWQANSMDNAGTVYINKAYVDGDATYVGRGVSTITVMEIKG